MSCRLEVDLLHPDEEIFAEGTKWLKEIVEDMLGFIPDIHVPRPLIQPNYLEVSYIQGRPSTISLHRVDLDYSNVTALLQDNLEDYDDIREALDALEDDPPATTWVFEFSAQRGILKRASYHRGDWRGSDFRWPDTREMLVGARDMGAVPHVVREAYKTVDRVADKLQKLSADGSLLTTHRDKCAQMLRYMQKLCDKDVRVGFLASL